MSPTAAIPDPRWPGSPGFGARRVTAAMICAAVAALVAGCSAGTSASGHHSGGRSHTPTRSVSTTRARLAAAPPAVRISIAPAGGVDSAPQRGLEVSASGGRISSVIVRTAGDRVSGTLNAAGTAWHSRWALNVSQRYSVVVTARAPSGQTVTRRGSFRTVTPSKTLNVEIFEGYHQTYGVGMPIILYLSQPVTDRAAFERALQLRVSRRVTGSWYWDTRCRLAAECLYFRPRHYWHPHTTVSFTAHLNGVQVAPGVYGDHTLTQTFTIGSSLLVVASTANHHMNVYRDGKLFAQWPISTGRPGDNTPNGTYLTIEKGNPVDMIGPGYNIEVPWSVRFTFSGDYLHDAYWSVGEQGFTNVSHGCVNMPPADAEIYYKMAVPGDPVKIVGSPRAGTWDNGWTVWFDSWKQWLRGSALHEAVLAGPHGSSFVGAGTGASGAGTGASGATPG